MVCVVTLIGGESTGKSTLARELAQALHAAGMPVAHVPEYLRQWCEREDRAPRADEQGAIAREQARQIDTAAAALRASGQPAVVVADTSPLVVAAYSDHYFQDPNLWPEALDWQARHTSLTLLMGQDLPWVPDGLFRDSPAVSDAIDSALRGALISARVPFQALYGRGAHRLEQALRAVARTLNRPELAPATPSPPPAQRWTCERCSDPDCEHRLFSRLVRPAHAG